MSLSNGCNHVTVVTGDLDRFIGFYTRVFEAGLRLDLAEGGLRHALLDMGGGFCLHPFQLAETGAHAAGRPKIFERGHIDHFALNFDDPATFEEVRRRLVAEGASTGRVRDFGLVRVMAFEDPDGMECEIALWTDGAVRTMPESRVEEFTPEPA